MALFELILNRIEAFSSDIIGDPLPTRLVLNTLLLCFFPCCKCETNNTTIWKVKKKKTTILKIAFKQTVYGKQTYQWFA